MDYITTTPRFRIDEIRCQPAGAAQGDRPLLTRGHADDINMPGRAYAVMVHSRIAPRPLKKGDTQGSGDDARRAQRS